MAAGIDVRRASGEASRRLRGGQAATVFQHPLSGRRTRVRPGGRGATPVPATGAGRGMTIRVRLIS
ncbi:hypothetical protein ACFU3E_37615 [Streptomyces sp. NPDC057424]|uniref:hypothetical protein n=1 Tax=Streptomyces sp. NPDC057424 TaxID=3346127 RepID=UPI00368E71B4